MASIRPEKRSDGGTTFIVRFRPPGTKTQVTERFWDDLPGAERFAADVEAAGNDWPAGWVKGTATPSWWTRRPQSCRRFPS
jgi:hypothetical protein